MMIKGGFMVHQKQERNIIDRINLDDVGKKMFENQIDFSKFFINNKRLSSITIKNINVLIRRCCKFYNIQLFDCLLIIDDRYIDLVKIIQILDGENIQTLKEEIGKRTNIKTKIKNIMDFLN